MQPLGVRVFNRKPYKFCRCAACRPHENDLENGRAREKQHTHRLIDEELDAGTLREGAPKSAARREGAAKKRKR